MKHIGGIRGAGLPTFLNVY